MADLSIERDLEIGTIGGIINSLLSAVLSSIESNRRTTSLVSATPVALSVTSASSSSILTRDASSTTRQTLSMTPSLRSSASQISSTRLSLSASSSTSSSSSSDPSTPTALLSTSNLASRSSYSVSALPEGVTRPPARLTTSRILIIALSIVAVSIVLLLLLFVILRRRRRFHLQDGPTDDSEIGPAGQRNISEKAERDQGSVEDEPVVRPRRFSSISKRLWQDPPKRSLTPSWGPLPTFPDSASLMTVVSHEQQFTPRFEIVNRDGLEKDDGSGQEARPWNLQRGYSDPMLNRPTGRAIEIAPIDTNKRPDSELKGEEEADSEEDEEDDDENKIVTQREDAEEKEDRLKTIRSTHSASSSGMLGYYSRSLRTPHQSTPEFCDASPSSYPFDTETKPFSSSHPDLDYFRVGALNGRPNRQTNPTAPLLAPPKPFKSPYRPKLATGAQTSSTAHSRRNLGFTLDGSNPFTD